jgi:hypothetical protein
MVWWCDSLNHLTLAYVLETKRKRSYIRCQYSRLASLKGITERSLVHEFCCALYTYIKWVKWLTMGYKDRIRNLSEPRWLGPTNPYACRKHNLSRPEELYLLEYNTVLSSESHSTFRRNIQSPPSGPKGKRSKKPEFSWKLAEQTLAYFHLTTRRYIPDDGTLQRYRCGYLKSHSVVQSVYNNYSGSSDNCGRYNREYAVKSVSKLSGTFV